MHLEPAPGCNSLPNIVLCKLVTGGIFRLQKLVCACGVHPWLGDSFLNARLAVADKFTWFSEDLPRGWSLVCKTWICQRVNKSVHCLLRVWGYFSVWHRIVLYCWHCPHSVRINDFETFQPTSVRHSICPCGRLSRLASAFERALK